MIRRLRLVVVLARPAVMLLLGLFTATGLAEAGHGNDTMLLIKALAAVLGFLLFSVTCNDLADEAIDRVNLPGQRPLVTGAASRREFTVIGLTSGVAAVAASATLRWPAAAVTAAGLAVSAGYSLRPVRLADRGAVASLVLPACYVAVPYLTGLFAARASVTPRDLLLLAGLYIAFIGRILLKDFRDVRGDALFGKRTFLVRRGREWTCAFSTCCWLAGTAVILAALPSPGTGLLITEFACLVAALALLASLARSTCARWDESLISAIAITGRGMVLLVLAHLTLSGHSAGVPGHLAGHGPGYLVVLAVICVLTLGPAATMAAYGPISRLTAPAVAPQRPRAMTPR
ncbi:MAG TPA: UbiA family prenyltransferase [Streptosporangiaceae bacterium]